MLSEEFLFKLSALDAKHQKEFMESIETITTEEERTALLIGIGFFRLLRFADLKEEIEKSMAKELYEEFTAPSDER